jgi:hypothetical protein
MVSQSIAELTRHQEALNQREASLQGRIDHMLNQRRVSMEQEFERRRIETSEACRVDFRSKTNAALVRYKQGRKTLERQVHDLKVELRGRTRCAGALSAPWLKLTPPSTRFSVTCRGLRRRTRRRSCRLWRSLESSRRPGRG